MSERQYTHYKELPRQSLGVMANQLWLDDPKMVGIHLARYKFVAKMLADKDRVAEVGCGDGWFSRVVMQTVKELSLYDFDQAFIEDIDMQLRLNGEKWEPDKIIRKDILSGDLYHKPYDAIYSLDVMEHIHPAQEEDYLNNIKASLRPNGVFIVGMPSLESQKYASPASKIGHVNCLSGEDLKRTLERHYHNVFMFGMNDETIHTGFFPMCHYLIGLCVGVK